MVDENRLEGAARDLGGAVQGAVGDLTGDSQTQARGTANQLVGKAQNAYGSAVDSAGDMGSTFAELAREHPFALLLSAASIGFVMRALTSTPHR